MKCLLLVATALFPCVAFAQDVTPGNGGSGLCPTCDATDTTVMSRTLGAHFLDVVNVRDSHGGVAGAVGDPQEVTDAQVQGGALANLYSPSATFTTTDVGKVFGLTQAGASTQPLIGTVAAFVDAHNLTLSAPASQAVPASVTSLACTTANASAVVTLASTTGVTPFMVIISGPGLTQGLKVSSFVANTSMTLSGSAGAGAGAGTCVLGYGATFYWATDDTAAFAAARTAAVASSPNAAVYAPAGHYLVDGAIVVQNGAFIGDSGQDTVTPYGSSGTVLDTLQTTDPVIQVGRGAALSRLRFYWPMQKGDNGINVSSYPTITGAPITYQPAIATYHAAAQGASGILLDDIVLYNAYDGIVLGDGTHAVGLVEQHNVNGFALDNFERVWNQASGGSVSLGDFSASVAWFQSVASAGGAADTTGQVLGKWAQKNSSFLRLSTTGDVRVAHGTAYGFQYGVVIDTGQTTNSSLSNILFDSMPVVLSITDGNGSVNNLVFDPNNTYYAADRFVTAIGSGAAYSPGAVFNFASLGVLADSTIRISGNLETAMAGVVDVANSNPPTYVVLDGLKAKGWGTQATTLSLGEVAAVYQHGTQTVQCNGCQLDDNSVYASATGFLQSAGTAQVNGGRWANNQIQFHATAGSIGLCTGLTTTATGSTVSDQVPGSGSYQFEPTNCRWDKPKAAPVDTRTNFAFHTAAAQIFNTTTLTPVYFETQEIDAGGDLSHVTTTCNGAASTSLTGCASIAGITSGMYIIDTTTPGNVPVQATVNGAPSGSTVTSSATSGTFTGDTLVFTTGVFTAPRSSTYRCSLSLYGASSDATSFYSIQLVGSGTNETSGLLWTPAKIATFSAPTLSSAQIFLVKNDTVTPEVKVNSGTGSFTLASGVNFNKFGCYDVGR